MNFILALRMECYKAIRRKTSKLCFLFIALPLFYGIAFANSSQAVTLEGEISAIGFASSCWALLGLTGFAEVLFVILASNYFGKEKENGQIKNLMLKNHNRNQVYFAKYLSVLFLVAVSYILMYISAICIYYAYIAASMADIQFCFGIEEFVWSITSDMLMLIWIIMTISTVTMFCMYCKRFFCIIVGMIISLLGSSVLQSVPIIAFADPFYVLNLYNEVEISTTGVWIYCVVYLVVSAIPVWVGLRKFQRSCIK